MQFIISFAGFATSTGRKAESSGSACLQEQLIITKQNCVEMGNLKIKHSLSKQNICKMHLGVNPK